MVSSANGAHLKNAVPRLVFAVHPKVHAIEEQLKQKVKDQVKASREADPVWLSCEKTFRCYQMLHAHFTDVGVRSGLSLEPLLVSDPRQFRPRSDAPFTLFVPLLDDAAVHDPAWSDAMKEVLKPVQSDFLFEPIPIALSSNALGIAGFSNAFRLEAVLAERKRCGVAFVEEQKEREFVLCQALTIEFISALDAFTQTKTTKSVYEGQKLRRLDVKFFLSHSKHDRLTGGFLEHLNLTDLLDAFLRSFHWTDTFYDKANMRTGPAFSAQLIDSVKDARMLVVFHSDTYSEREWCRRELVQAKYSQKPVFVIHCVEDGEASSMPYLGNAPVSRLNLGSLPQGRTRAEAKKLEENDSTPFVQAAEQFKADLPDMFSKMLREVLRHAHWRATVASLGFDPDTERNERHHRDVAVFFQQPELLSVWNRQLHAGRAAIALYPDPPLPPDLASILENGTEKCTFLSLSQYLAGLQPDGSVSYWAKPTLDEEGKVTGPLQGRRIALSASVSHNMLPDMGKLGVSETALVDAQVELCRMVLSLGGRIFYGGTPREMPKGVPNLTDVLFELALSFAISAETRRSAPVVNVLAWNEHITRDIAELEADFDGIDPCVANRILLDLDGREISFDQRKTLPTLKTVNPADMARGLTAMRRWVSDATEARIFLGGRHWNADSEGSLKTGGFPGLLEEALFAMKDDQPSWFISGFGGAAFDIAAALEPERFTREQLELLHGPAGGVRQTQYLRLQKQLTGVRLPSYPFDGLTLSERTKLASASSPTEITSLVLRGMIAALT